MGLNDFELKQRIAAEVDAKMQRHNLKEAYKRLQECRTTLKLTKEFIDDTAIKNQIDDIIINRLEILMWKIETAVREDK